MIAGVGDHDRNAILARRALFISAAFAGLGCTTHSPSNEPEAEPSASSVDPPTVVVEPPPVGSEEPPTDGVRPSWSEVMAAAPPLDVPAGLTETEHGLLTHLASFQRGRYDELAKIWHVLPDCSPSAADCEEWTHVIERIRQVNPQDYGPLCGYSHEITNTYLQRERAHDQYLLKISDMLLADLDAAVDARVNPADSEAWQTQRASLHEPQPTPCLSCRRPLAAPITDAIPFAPGEAKLTQSTDVDQRLVSAHATHQSNGRSKAKLIVRGHASPSEADPESLARQRAEVVAEALIALGANRRDIEVRAYADSLPISSDPAEVALNCRVDFEVVVP